MIQKYSLFQTEKISYVHFAVNVSLGDELVQNCFEYLKTYDTLKEAQIAQKENKQKTLILASY